MKVDKLIRPILILILYCATGSARSTAKECPLNWLDEGCEGFTVFKDTCYCLFNYFPRHWDQADAECKRIGGYLAMPKTKEISDFLNTELSQTYEDISPIWIGLHDKVQEKNFVWVDGTPVGWTNWENKYEGPRDEPVSLGQQAEDCVEMSPYYDGTWRDLECHFTSVFRDLTRPFMCEYNMSGRTAPGTDEGPDGGEGKTSKEQHEKKEPNTKDDKERGNDDNGNNESEGKDRKDNDEHKCPIFNCKLYCGLNGYTVSEKGCPQCECAYDE